MAKLNLKTVEARVSPLGGQGIYNRNFFYDLLLAYGKPKGNVTRLRNGSLNVAADPSREIAQKNVVYVRETAGDPIAEIEDLRTAAHVVRYSPRFVIVTDYSELVAIDTKTNENLAIPIWDIDKHFTFFLPWAGMEKAQYVAESHADLKAAERMGKLFDELLSANPGLLELPRGRHALNIFFTRLLFCFFAEDTAIFEENQFTNAVGSHTQQDGSDVADLLGAIFEALDTEDPSLKPPHLSGFPYVNGRLFAVTEEDLVPVFTKTARAHLIELGTLMWQEINPDIFGSMFQAIVTPGRRTDLGQHYTSVPNILKAMEPLFLDEIRDEFNMRFDSVQKLEKLLDRISSIKVFDPACGSGNFLVIAYKELRRLEHAILERMAELSAKHQTLYAVSRISVESFYGIEVDDFAGEVAVLSLWIAKHQMNRVFKDKFGVDIPLIPLREAGQIRVANAARVDWDKICPNTAQSEVYLIGNPPYYGSGKQTPAQKEDYKYVFGNRPYSKKLNYIALWFFKGAEYLAGTPCELAFVTTKTVTQGEHVGLMFPMIQSMGVEIGFAHTGFQWDNNAKANADVTVAVISLRRVSSAKKYLFVDGLELEVSNINGYLADGDDVFVDGRNRPLSNLPKMSYGSKPTFGGDLLLEPDERDEIIATSPEAEVYIKKALGSEEFINGYDRYCIWVGPQDYESAREIPDFKKRFDRTALARAESPKVLTQKLADVPYRFGEVRFKPTESIIVPSVSSGLREYIPVGYLGPDTVITNAAFAIYDCDPWVLSLLTSRMHMTWVRAVAGRMRINYRYSNTIVYNNFPVPQLSAEMEERLTVAALRILDVREYHCEKTLAELYEAERMPTDLRAAHEEVDALVDSIYSMRDYETDEERLSDLFAMYEAMIAAQHASAGKTAKRSKV